MTMKQKGQIIRIKIVNPINVLSWDNQTIKTMDTGAVTGAILWSSFAIPVKRHKLCIFCENIAPPNWCMFREQIQYRILLFTIYVKSQTSSICFVGWPIERHIGGQHPPSRCWSPPSVQLEYQHLRGHGSRWTRSLGHSCWPRIWRKLGDN